MGKVIEFLERVGSDATLRHADAETLAAALADTDIDDATRAALMDGDRETLHRLLGERPFIVAQMQIGPDEVEVPGDDKEENDKEDDGPAISRTPVSDESR
ncbi:hypothetical protein SAMN02800694_2658 [Luteibacter sp. UNCMF331Sha3.1]|uniref:hypothetical protein n=1 Tax=Luteibacter sp. UNCMF331Sha3.1 TaxID=1502760 RepID=UPI0004BC27C5|nr:hypothetical protein [Luteibacter sp. UNCMF331Sha3.1]SEN06613.1 hypothetical protein SAMN02800694_2658 [Luteibacter sp. UNCMF331Sha3.1]